MNGQLTSRTAAILVLVILYMEDHIRVVRILRSIELGRDHKQSSTVPEFGSLGLKGPAKPQKAVKGIYKMKVIFKTSRNRTPYDHLQQKYPTEVILVIRQIVGNWRLSYELHQLHPIV